MSSLVNKNKKKKQATTKTKQKEQKDEPTSQDETLRSLMSGNEQNHTTRSFIRTLYNHIEYTYISLLTIQHHFSYNTKDAHRISMCHWINNLCSL